MTVTQKARKAVCDATAQVIADSGMTAYGVAMATGITPSAVYKYVNATRSPREAEIALIEQVCRVPAGRIDELASTFLGEELAVA